MTKAAVYGYPPRELAVPPPGAAQCSPLVPGSVALDETPPGSLAHFTALAPPGTIERRYVLAHALRALAPGGDFTFLAPKDKGGSRLAQELRAFGVEFTEDARAHHRICVGTRPAGDLPLEAAMEEGAPRLVEKTGLWSQPGVFSWDREDPGSKLLAEQLPKLIGRGADFGGGLGYLTRVAFARGNIEHVDFFEIDRRALFCARRNLEKKPVRFHWADLRQEQRFETGLDFVLLNPPFHDGGVEDQSLGQTFIRQAGFVLRPGGTAWVVANRHLPYETTLRAVFSAVNLRAETGAFKVFEAIR